jgi:hypothetical protein
VERKVTFYYSKKSLDPSMLSYYPHLLALFFQISQALKLLDA